MINSDDRGIKLFRQMEDDVSNYKFLTIVLEAILVGLAFAISTVWSEVIISTSRHWLDDWVLPLQDLIAAVIVTIFSIAAAGIAVFVLVIHPRQKLRKLRNDCNNSIRTKHKVIQDEVDQSKNWLTGIPASRDV